MEGIVGWIESMVFQYHGREYTQHLLLLYSISIIIKYLSFNHIHIAMHEKNRLEDEASRWELKVPRYVGLEFEQLIIDRIFKH